MILTVRPANDRFAAATELSGESATDISSLRTATAEPGELAHWGDRSDEPVWWRWTAPRPGFVKLSDSAHASGMLTVYVGSDLESLFPVTGSDSGHLDFTATAGTTYWLVAFDWPGGWAPQEIHFSLQMAPVVPNDAFAQALPLIGTDLILASSGEGATSEPGEPISRPGRDRTVWWTWTATADGYLTVTRASPENPTTLEVFYGASLRTLAPIPSVTDYGDGTVEIPVIGSSAYFIRLRFGNDQTEAQFRLRFQQLPPNDSLSQARTLDTLPAQLEFSFEFASFEENEPNPPSIWAQTSLWY